MSNLNVVEAIRSYVNRMIDDCGPTAKGLVMDKETVEKIDLKFYIEMFIVLSRLGVDR